MQFSTLLIGSLVAVASAPATPILKERSSPSYACDVSQLSQPAAPTTLPAPPAGLSLMLVALGKGTQNYTCADGNPSTVPTLVGAVATLYNASCLTTSSQAYVNVVTQWADTVPARDLAGLPIVGHHYFVDTTTPTFNLTDVGTTESKKVGTSNAPVNSTDVPWLFLKKQTTGTTDKVSAIYRLETKDGVAPATCSGMAAGPFTVPYSAQYWFYSS
jgi:hypothetical protein